jgi:hypothetical protein
MPLSNGWVCGMQLQSSASDLPSITSRGLLIVTAQVLSVRRRPGISGSNRTPSLPHGLEGNRPKQVKPKLAEPAAVRADKEKSQEFVNVTLLC